jgi:hypothetical protein
MATFQSDLRIPGEKNNYEAMCVDGQINYFVATNGDGIGIASGA